MLKEGRPGLTDEQKAKADMWRSLQRLGSRIWVRQVVESSRDLRRVSRQPLDKSYEIIL
jgi:hypothetical protein